MQSMGDFIDTAKSQWSYITTKQAKQIGCSPTQLSRLVQSGRITRTHHGLYKLADADDPPHQELIEPWILMNPEMFTWNRKTIETVIGIVAGPSAANLYSIGNLNSTANTFLTTKRIRMNKTLYVTTEITKIERKNWTFKDGIPVVTVQRLIHDFATGGLDGSHLGILIRDALRKNLILDNEVIEALNPAAAGYGFRSGEELLDSLLYVVGADVNIYRLATAALSSPIRKVARSSIDQLLISSSF